MILFYKKLIQCAILLFVSSVVLALPAKKLPHYVKLTIDFQMYQKNQKQMIKTMHFVNVVGINTTEQKWIQLNSVQSQPILNASHSLPHAFPTFSTVLTQFKKADHQQVVVKFLILNLNGNTNLVLEPTVVAEYGKKSVTRLYEGNQYINLQIFATPVN